MPNRFVEKLLCYAELSSEDIALAERVTSNPRKVGARQDLIREGDRPGPVFVMLEGWACRYKILPEGGRQIVAFLMPGDTCDMHVAVLAQMDHSIQTLSASRVAMISRAEMHELVTTRAQIAHALWSTQLVDESTMRAWIVSMGRRDGEARVAHLMCELFVRARNIGLIRGNTLEIPVSQVILADSLGMTPVHINRILRRLRIAGLMELGRGKLTILDPPGLVKVAGFDETYLHNRMRRAA
ncbi:Crp/Fnr family transcriptional regulator [Sphingomonas sp. SUN019]|uniref:Crp/Fnr family transcriptional regulator n=1 Tax=Sphingomonas sp. SUN019 TaxID=2937788 RepID=UPI002164D9E6|nr:Crp/Fnr family transcriptional regulator [Sphingomonas sp. SUN019]UVO49459.1 Crp/Fnr family transcriptional regulator [Sphingomonas sp. SUN019]